MRILPEIKSFNWMKRIVCSMGGSLFMIIVFLITISGNQGCSNKTPSLATFVATATPTVVPNVIDNLEDGDTYLNPAMSGMTSTGVPLGFWVASTWGDSSNVIDNSAGANVVFCGGVGANNTSCAIHIYGNLKDNGDNQYPAFQLEGKLKGGNYFDASAYPYTGIRFYIKIGAGDTCSDRRFNVPIGLTTPPSGGGYCASNCYGHFGSSVGVGGAVATGAHPTGTGVWSQQSYPFTGLSPVYGPALGKTLAGNYLKELLEVEWVFGRNGVAGTSTVDYWVDEVEFF